MANKTKTRKKLGDTVKKPAPLPKADVDLEGLEKITEPKRAEDAKPQAPTPAKKEPEKVETKRLSVDLEKSLFAKFKARCAEQDTTIKERVVEWIRQDVGVA